MKTKFLVIATFALLLSLIPFTWTDNAQEEITIIVGESKTIDVESPQSIAIGNEAFAKAKFAIQDKKILLTGIAEGTTTLIIIDKQNNEKKIKITVLAYDPEELAKLLSKLLKDYDGISILKEGNQILLKGEILTPAQYEEISKTISQYKQVLNLLKISQQFYEVTAEKIQNEINIPGITVKAEGSKIVLKGSVSKKETADEIIKIANVYSADIVNLLKIEEKPQEEINVAEIKRLLPTGVNLVVSKDKVVLSGKALSKKQVESAGKIASAYFPNVTNLITVDDKTNIQIDVKVVEMSVLEANTFNLNLLRDSFSLQNQFNYGLNQNYDNRQPQDPTASAGASSGQSSFFLRKLSYNGLVSIDLNIDALMSEGKAKLFARPKLITKNGGKARFQSGGEYPIKVIINNKGAIQWKDYGTILEIQPNIEDGGVIDLDITAEVSSLGPYVEGVPSVLSRKVKTQVKLNKGESIVIAGLIKSEKTEGIDRFPLLGYIPIIGELFKTTLTASEEKELFIFVTPGIVETKEMQIKEELKLLKDEIK